MRLLFLLTFFVAFQMKATIVHASVEADGTISPEIIQQSRQAKGKIVDQDGLELIGAVVEVKETGEKAVTGIDGRYAITANAGQTLLFSCIGHVTIERVIPLSYTLDVVMESDTQALEEVVVVGYGKQKKISVTGSIAQVVPEEMLKTSTPNMATAIAGKMPGIITRQSSGEPGYDAAQVFIRGMASFGNNSPLILIDGVERDMNLINTQEVESFTVLKDASATAVYGARGANGVILITTKRGKVGKPSITFRSEVAMLQAQRLPDYINAFEYASLMNEALAFNSSKARWSDTELRKFADGSDPYLYPNSNWTDLVMRENTWQTINNLSVTGGSDIIKYYMNVGYTVQDGLWREDSNNPYNTNTKVNRYNFRSNMDINLAKNFVVQLGLGGIIQTSNYPGYSSDNILHALRIVSPIAYPPLNPDGTVSGVNSYKDYNPYARTTQSGYSMQDRVTVQGSFAANWDMDFLLKGLSTRAMFAYDRYARTDNNRLKEFGVKTYMGKDANGEDIYSLVREEQPMIYSRNNEGTRSTYLELQLNYARSFGKHDVTAMALFNQREYVNLNAGDSRSNIPSRRQGYSGRATYTYGGRYLGEFNFGYNGSENFPKDRRFGFFPSGSIGWIVSEEAFWNKKVVNRLKLRASHGLVGNDQIGQRFLFMSTINPNGQTYPFGHEQVVLFGMDENQIGNPFVTWEKATKTDIGLDIGLLDDRISLQVDFFHEKRKDILLQRGIVPRMTGIYPWAIPYANLGEVKNQGFDALLEIRNTHKNGFFYSLQGNFTFARNEVIENDEPLVAYPYLTEKGYRLGQYRGFVSNGFFKDEDDIASSPTHTLGVVRPGDVKYKDINGDGVINSYDQVPMGYARTPEISFGFGGTVGYKNFDFSLFFIGAANTTVNVAGFGTWPFYDGLGQNNVLREYYNNRWTPENTNARYPAVDERNNPNNFVASDIYLKNGNYLRLRNAEIGYTLPKKLVAKYNFTEVRFFINGMNLYTWDHIKFMDPESNDGVGAYPLQRSFNIGVQLNFN